MDEVKNDPNPLLDHEGHQEHNWLEADGGKEVCGDCGAVRDADNSSEQVADAPAEAV